MNSFLLTRWQITECIGPTHTYIQSKRSTLANTRTDLEVRGGIKTHHGSISSHPSPYTDTFSLSVATVSGDGLPFLHYLSGNNWRSCCASRIVLSMSCCPSFPQCFHLWFLLHCYCRNSILKAMMTQQQATQGLFRSPILAHFQKIPRRPVLFLSSRVGASALM